MAKHIRFHAEAQQQILAGFNIVADAVGATLGPRGQTVVISRPVGEPLVTKDGVTVASHIVIEDRWQNEAAKLIQTAAQKTNTEAGDGTTAATILTRALYAEGLRRIEAGADRRAIERGIRQAVAVVVAELKRFAEPVTEKDLSTLVNVATVAANGDKALGDIIGLAVQKIGLQGKITLDQSPTNDTTFDPAPGLQFQRGFISPSFMANPERGRTVYDNCSIFVTDRRMIDDQQMGKFLERYLQARGKAPLLIVCEDCEGAALQMLALNVYRGVLNVVPVRTPAGGAQRKEQIEDIAIFSGGRPYMIQSGDSDPAALRIDDLGYADRVIVTAQETTIIGGAGAQEGKRLRLDTRLEELRTRLNEPNLADFNRAVLEQRIAALEARVGVIRIGKSVHAKLLEKRDRIEDSVNATMAALGEGIVPGGGTALIRCLPALDAKMDSFLGDELLGAEIVAHALTEPLRTIARNAGVEPERHVRVVTAWNADGHPRPAPGLRDRLLPLSLRMKLWPERHVLLATRFVSSPRWGYNAELDRFEDLVLAGIVDPAKVVRLSLENSAELAGLMLTTAALIVDFPDPAAPLPTQPGVPVISRS